MSDKADLQILLKSRVPVIVVETREEERALGLFKRLFDDGFYQPMFGWTVTRGLYRLDILTEPQRSNAKPHDVLAHIRASELSGIYILKDFHPYLDDPVIVRMLREIAQSHSKAKKTLVLISPSIELPDEIAHMSARFNLSMPDRDQLKSLLLREVDAWKESHRRPVKGDKKAVELLLNHLLGLSYADAKRLIRNIIYDDGAITHADVKDVMDAKYELLGGDGVLSYESETAHLAEVAGLQRMKHWLQQRKAVFNSDQPPAGLDMPKGVLLLGVQGAGKSLAAKAVAGSWDVPLLRLDFATLYNRFYGETERNLRKALETAQVMAPCVLWIDEIEKGLSTDQGSDGGPSKRILGTLLTWMAERRERVFLVATANDIEDLPPELMRKGRFDEIFFVDLPAAEVREEIFRIHLRQRDIELAGFDWSELADASEGFSGAEIEQAVVSGLYTAHAQQKTIDMDILLQELGATKPLSVVMSEKIQSLRDWAASRTVMAD